MYKLFFIISIAFYFQGCFFDSTPKTTTKVFSTDSGLPPSAYADLGKAVEAMLAMNSPLPAFPPLNGVMEEVDRKFPRVSRARKIAAIKTSILSFTSRHGIPAADISDSCFIDYSAPCPEGWTEFDNACFSADGYTGECEGRSEIPSTVASKRAFAQRCVATWPCLNDCARNFQVPCPENWFLRADGFCVADVRVYRGKCVLALDTRHYDVFMRKELSRICELKFPCLKSSTEPEILMLPPIKAEIRRVELKDVPGFQGTSVRNTSQSLTVPSS